MSAWCVSWGDPRAPVSQRALRRLSHVLAAFWPISGIATHCSAPGAVALATSVGYAGQIQTYAETIARSTGKRAAGPRVPGDARTVVSITERP